MTAPSRLTRRFLLAFTGPLLAASIAVLVISTKSMEENAVHTTLALSSQAHAERALTNLLIQEDTTKALLLDSSRLGELSAKKLAAYDTHKQMLAQQQQDLSDPALLTLVDELEAYDREVLRPIDSKILEALFIDQALAEHLYIEDYEPARATYQAKVEYLSQELRVRVTQASQATQARIQRALYQIAAVLALAVLSIASAVLILGRRADRSARETDALLSGMQDGLLYFESDGRLSESRSTALDRLLPGHADHHDLSALMAHFCGLDPETTAFILEALWPDPEETFYSSFEDCCELLPKVAELGPDGDRRVLEFHYRAAWTGDTLRRVYCSIRDVTESRAQQAEARALAQRVRRISAAAEDLQASVGFLDETEQRFESAKQALAMLPRPEHRTRLERELHTIKGTVASYGFSTLATQVHELESALARGTLDSSAFDGVHALWTQQAQDLSQVLRLDTACERWFVDRNAALRLKRALITAPDGSLKHAAASILRVPIASLFHRYEVQARAVARKRGVAEPHFVYPVDNARIERAELQTLDGTLIQLIRNAVDHGLEPPEDRVARGKAAVGTITVRVERTPAALRLEIEDDGQGLQEEGLASRAVELGVWTEEEQSNSSPECRQELIFHPGLSSKVSLSEVSGRGVGMDLVRAQILDLCGTIEVTSTQGQGTCFTVELPLRAPRSQAA